jgi:hypothetical protein
MNCVSVVFGLGLTLCALLPAQSAEPTSDDAQTVADDWLFLDNGQLRLGVKKSSGAGIAWLSESGSKKNLVNHFDRGRLIQQSYYGKPDGSLWNKQPWRWNPVQGGDWQGKPAQVLELKSGRDWLSAKTLPKHWASGEDITDAQMEQTIRLVGNVAHVHYRFKYSGNEKHPAHHQEIPAVFVEPQYDTLVLFDGDKPWTNGQLHRSKPGWPNESRKITEHWAAYVDANDYGLGAFVPVAKELTCYRFGRGDAKQGACSYFAPLTTFAIEPGFEWEYDLYLTLGKIDDIRQRFASIEQQRHEKTADKAH